MAIFGNKINKGGLRGNHFWKGENKSCWGRAKILAGPKCGMLWKLILAFRGAWSDGFEHVKILAVKTLFVYTDFMAQATRKKNRRIVLAEFESFQLCL